MKNFSFISLDDGSYVWNVNCTDYAENFAFNNTNFTIHIDAKNPRINFTDPTPANNTNQSSTTVIINVTHIEINPNTIVLYWNGTINETRGYSGNFTNFTLNNLNESFSVYLKAKTALTKKKLKYEKGISKIGLE